MLTVLLFTAALNVTAQAVLAMAETPPVPVWTRILAIFAPARC